MKGGGWHEELERGVAGNVGPKKTRAKCNKNLEKHSLITVFRRSINTCKCGCKKNESKVHQDFIETLYDHCV